MRTSIQRTTSLSGLSVALLSLLSCIAVAQDRQIRIEGAFSSNGVVPGQMVEVYVSGIPSQLGPPIPLDRFQVFVTQGGVNRQAKVCSASLGLVNSQALSTTLPSRTENISDLSEQLAGMKTYQVVTFTVPVDFREGEAIAVVKYRDKRTNEFKFKVANGLPVPRVGIGMELAGGPLPLTPPSPDAVKEGEKRGLRLERGRDNQISVRPLIDPDIPGASVLVTFKQGSLIKSASARVVRLGGTESNGSTVTFAPVHYELNVHIPEELEPGAASIEVRLKLRGQTSEPATADVMITDSSGRAGSTDEFKPRVMNLGELRIGAGQVIQLSINSKWLEPDPSKALIVLEQGSERVELEPEMNSATLRGGLTGPASAVLFARILDTDLRGKVMARVYNSAKGERDGLSEGTEIEIVDEVVPPLGLKVSEAGKSELAMLRALRDEALKHGREFKDYDPNARYVTIRAIGLDYNPNYIKVTFEQDGRQYVLKFADFSLSMDERLVVRVPDAIKLGSVKITIQNKGEEGLSDPVIETIEITQPVKK